MLTLSEARVLAEKRLMEIAQDCADELQLLDEVVEMGDVVAFHYQSAEYVRTRSIVSALAGNGPILVNLSDGRVGLAGTALPLMEYVHKFRVDASNIPIDTDGFAVGHL